MAVAKNTSPPTTAKSPSPKPLLQRDAAPPRPSELASTLRLVATAAEAVYADGYREPGDIAADDVGASDLATELNASPNAKGPVDQTPGLQTTGHQTTGTSRK